MSTPPSRTTERGIFAEVERDAFIGLPTDDEPVTFHDSVQGTHPGDAGIRSLHRVRISICAGAGQVDRIAGYLKELQDAGVPGLLRPYHEMNGNWFWWGWPPRP